MSSGALHPVILVRHAHADWPAFHGCDFDRPLTPQGEADAATTARAIHAAGNIPAMLLASPALRTRQTAAIIARSLGLDEAAIVLVESLYNGSADVLETELHRGTAATSGVVMLVAHNPGISELARRLGGDPSCRSFAPGHWQLLHLTRSDAPGAAAADACRSA